MMRNWTDAEVKTMVRLTKKHKAAEVARMLGRTKSAIQNRLYKYQHDHGMVNQQPVQYYRKPGTSYKRALPPEDWPMAETFLRCLTAMCRYAAKTGQRPRIDLVQFGEAVRERMREIMI